MSMPKKGIFLGGGNIRRDANMTQQIMKSATKLNNIDESDDEQPMQSEKATLAKNIREANFKNARPKTRGDPIVQNLDMTPPPLQDYAQVTSLDNNDINSN